MDIKKDLTISNAKNKIATSKKAGKDKNRPMI